MIVYVVLAHEKPEIAEDMIRNLRIYDPGGQIVFYNGGGTDFGAQLAEVAERKGVLVCPRSRQLKWGKLGHVLYDVMDWLEEIRLDYEYLVYLDSDMMCVNPGFPAFLERTMHGYDCMGPDTWIEWAYSEETNEPAKSLWREWNRWQPIFGTDFFVRTLNACQVYRHSIVRQILSAIDRAKLEALLASTETIAIEEFLYMTLAVRCGGKHRSYPSETSQWIRLGPLSAVDVQQAQQNPQVFFVHKILTDYDDPVRTWIREQSRRHAQSPRVTVLMPVYNGAVHLREAIDSILNQTYRDFEFLIIDDGSQDNSVEVVQSYEDPRIRLIRNEANIGLPATLNKGIRLARGEYIARMDGDDAALPERLERQVAFLDLHPEIGMVGAWLTLLHDHDVWFCYPEHHDYLKCLLLFRNYVGHPTVTMRREVLLLHNIGYDETMWHAEDYDLWIRLSFKTRLHNMPEILHRYRIHGGSVSAKHWQEQFRTVDRIHRIQLEKLGLSPTAEELEIHKRIWDNSQPKNEQVKKWLKKIWRANRKKKLYPDEMLNRVLHEVYESRLP